MTQIRFRAVLPQDAQTPVKPTKDFNASTGERRVRVWLDAFLVPGDTEKLLLLSDSELSVTIDAG